MQEVYLKWANDARGVFKILSTSQEEYASYHKWTVDFFSYTYEVTNLTSSFDQRRSTGCYQMWIDLVLVLLEIKVKQKNLNLTVNRVKRGSWLASRNWWE